MKILHIIPSLKKGGAERLVLDICRKLSENLTHVVKLVTFESSNDYLDLTESIDWTVVPAKAELSFLKKDKLYISELQEFINSFKPNIIHTHLFEAEIICSFIKYTKTKWISHCHGNMPQFENFNFNTIFRKSKITNYYEKKYLFNRYKKNGGTHFIAISNSTKKYFEKTAKPYQVTKLNNAINYNKFYKKLSEKACSPKLRLINVGSISENKNQQFLLKVVEVLKDKDVDFQLVIAGDGLIRSDLEALAENTGISHFVKFLGIVNNVEEYLWGSDIYVHSAKSEALGLTLLEAMAAGLPVITLDGKGNRDLIEQDKNGYMIYEQNAELFAQTIINLWNDKQKYQEMSAYGQEYAKGFDIKEYVDKLLVLYQNAINGEG